MNTNQHDYELQDERNGVADVIFSDSETTGTELLPRGTYDAVVLDVELKFAKQSGNPYYNWSFELTDPEHAGVHVYGITSLGPKSRAAARETLQAISGIRQPEGPFSMDEHRDEYVGHAVRLKMEPREYEGVLRNNVARILPAPNAVPQPTGRLFG